MWTLKLRPDVRFEDGTPLDAEAVAKYWSRLMDPATGSPSLSQFDLVESTEVIDDLTLVVHLSAPDSTFIEVLATNPGQIPSPAAVEQFGSEFGTTPETTIGAGPFRLAEYVSSDHTTLERFEDYWDAPKPYLERVVLRQVPDPQTRYNLFTGGTADVFETWSAGEFPERLDDAANEGEFGVVDAAAEDAAPISFIGPMCWNNSIAPTDDARVRQAAYYAVDFPL